MKNNVNYYKITRVNYEFIFYTALHNIGANKQGCLFFFFFDDVDQVFKVQKVIKNFLPLKTFYDLQTQGLWSKIDVFICLSIFCLLIIVSRSF